MRFIGCAIEKKEMNEKTGKTITPKNNNKFFKYFELDFDNFGPFKNV
jgi:hypothetical protein